MTETEVTYSRLENYSRSMRGGRRRRQTQRGQGYDAKSFNDQLLPTKVWPALLWSILISVLSVANPFLTQVANNLQSQDFYAGMAMQAGQTPYGHFFGTNGVLYYLLSYVGSFYGTTIGFAFLQFVALLIAGIYFYKICTYFSRSAQVATELQHWFYLFILALNFGGVQASLFVLPVLFTSLWFLIRYFENAVRDEAFILYGIDAAIAFMMYPKSGLLWVVSVLVLLVYNATHRKIARGIYQALANLFGFLVVTYSVGYYTFVAQILGAAIQQTMYELRLTFNYQGVLWTLAQVGMFLIFSGFVKHFVQAMGSLKQGRHTYIKVIVLLTFLLQLLFVVASNHFVISQLVLLLPYGFIMALVHYLPEGEEKEFDEAENTSYLRSSFYLPIFLCFLMFLQPVVTYFIEGDLTEERASVSRYIRSNSQRAETIYAWDNSAQIYLQSERLSAGEILTATPYLDSKKNQDSLIFDLNKNNARYIVVNSQLTLLDDVKSNLERNYEKVDLGTNQLTLYEKNNERE